jgi:DNA invertase Pin-like site-specific DNA recombinase
MLGKLAPGDVVTVTRIDRLARSTFDLCRCRQAHRGRQGAIPILGRTVGRHRRQHWALDAAILAGLADVERDLMRTRTAEGRSRAKAQGKQMDRPTAPRPPDAARRALRLTNLRAATMSAFQPFAVLPAPSYDQLGQVEASTL